jgi:hypothetical protein
MTTFLVIGPHTVAGVAPGDTVTAEHLAANGGDPAHLIAAGHIQPAPKAATATPPPPIEADEADHEENA